MPERRNESRPDGPDRRSFPRPPLWLTLLLLVLGVSGILFARYHREKVSSEFSDVLIEQERTPGDAKQMKDQLAEMDLNRDSLKTDT